MKNLCYIREKKVRVKLPSWPTVGQWIHSWWEWTVATADKKLYILGLGVESKCELHFS